MSTLRHTAHNYLKAGYEAVTRVKTTSDYGDTGTLTPEEFVTAGDYLVATCPTWQWEGGESGMQAKYLPEGKQMLVCRGVPCLRRAKDMENAVDFQEDAGDDDGFTTVGGTANASEEEIAEIPDDEPTQAPTTAAAALLGNDDDDDDDDDDIPDMDEYAAAQDPSALPPPTAPASSGDNLLKTRTYDMTVTYDKFYQTPRIWLFGYDENRAPLPTKALLEDVSAEHSLKTCTVESHPHLKCHATSIHPCRHADVMKRLTHQLGDVSVSDDDAGTSSAEPSTPVEHYMILFLKFAQTVLPTLEYDFTMSA